MRHEVMPDGVVNSRREGHLEFRSDTVATRDEHRLTDIHEGSVEHSSETPDLGHDVFVEGRFGKFLYSRSGDIGRIDVDTGVFISE